MHSFITFTFTATFAVTGIFLVIMCICERTESYALKNTSILFQKGHTNHKNSKVKSKENAKVHLSGDEKNLPAKTQTPNWEKLEETTHNEIEDKIDSFKYWRGMNAFRGNSHTSVKYSNTTVAYPNSTLKYANNTKLYLNNTSVCPNSTRKSDYQTEMYCFDDVDRNKTLNENIDNNDNIQFFDVLREASNIGVRFQKEFCLNRTISNSSDETNTFFSSEKRLLRLESFQCSDYPGNRWLQTIIKIESVHLNANGRYGSDDKNESTEDAKTPENKTRETYIFTRHVLPHRKIIQYMPSRYVTIIASCPEDERKQASQGEEATIEASNFNINQSLSRNNIIHVYSKKKNYLEKESKFSEKNSDKKHLKIESESLRNIFVSSNCNNCLQKPNLVSLMTSSETGNTYCNMDCFKCNENLTPSQTTDRLEWERSKFCRVGNMSDSSFEKAFPSLVLVPDLKHDASDLIVTLRETYPVGSGLGSLAKICWLEFEPPPAIWSKDYSFESALFRNGNECEFELVSDMDNITFRKIEYMCDSFYWPVFSYGFLYRNIFCFFCQQVRFYLYIFKNRWNLIIL